MITLTTEISKFYKISGGAITVYCDNTEALSYPIRTRSYSKWTRGDEDIKMEVLNAIQAYTIKYTLAKVAGYADDEKSFDYETAPQCTITFVP